LTHEIKGRVVKKITGKDPDWIKKSGRRGSSGGKKAVPFGGRGEQQGAFGERG